MAKCINISSSDFKSLVEISGISPIELAAKMNLWMSENDTDVWPTLEQLNIEYNKPEDFETKELSDTETVEDSYMAMFDDEGEFILSEYAEEEFNFNDEQEQKVEFDLNEGVLSSEEKKSGLNLSFANLTSTLIYQRKDINGELQNLYGKLKNSEGKERHEIQLTISKLAQKRDDLDDKIKESKKLSNLEQIVEFGEDAISEVSKMLSEGNLTDKQLNYLKRITDF